MCLIKSGSKCICSISDDLPCPSGVGMLSIDVVAYVVVATVSVFIMVVAALGSAKHNQNRYLIKL